MTAAADQRLRVVPVTTLEQVRALAAGILDPARDRPLIAVTTKDPRHAQPFLDVNSLAAAVAPLPVHVLVTGELTWELTALLPDELDVFGGAARIWWPGLRSDDEPRRHPLVFCYGPYEAPVAEARLVRELAARGWTEREHTPAPAAAAPVAVSGGVEAAGVVTALTYQGVDIDGDDGAALFAPAALIGASCHPREVFAVGQRVAGVLTGRTRADGRVELDLRTPLVRAGVAGAVIGALYDGVVTEAQPGGVEVQFAPGVRGWLPLRRRDPHPGVGAEVCAKVIGIDSDQASLHLAFPTGAELAAAASVSSVTIPTQPLDLPYPDRDGADEGALAPAAPLLVPVPAAGPPAADDVSVAADADVAGLHLGAAEDLTDAVEAAIAHGQARLADMRTEATELRRALSMSLAAARTRVLHFVHAESADIVAALESDLADAQEQAAQLQRQLRQAEADKRSAIEQYRLTRDRLNDTSKELRAERDARAHLEAQLHGHGVHTDPVEQFLHEIRTHIARAYTEDDRQRHPMVEVRLGAEFLDSLERTQGIDRSKVVEVCADVATGRAYLMPAREVHPLRTGPGGEDPQRVRADGAKGFRASLQIKTSSAIIHGGTGSSAHSPSPIVSTSNQTACR